MSIRTSTWNQYSTYIRKWFRFSEKRKTSPSNPTLSDILYFLDSQKGSSHSKVTTARAALTFLFTCWDNNILQTNEPLVAKFIKGLWNQNPDLPGKTPVWNPARLLSHVKQNKIIETEDFLLLSQTTVTLLALATAARVQTLAALNIDTLQIMEDNSYIFPINVPLKTSSVSNHLVEVRIHPFTDETLCPVSFLEKYISKTSSLRSNNNSNLFISTQKPYSKVSQQTLSRWIKTCLKNAGIQDKAHSIRASSTSAVFFSKLPVDKIIQKAGWTSESTFAKYYKRPLLESGEFQNKLYLSSLLPSGDDEKTQDRNG